jgi:hypothetical protein
MEEFQAEDKKDGMRRNKCTKVENKQPLPVVRNELRIEEEPCITVTTNSELIRLPSGLEDIGDDNNALP